ncbi:bacitracin synthase 3 domain protein [Bacillus atrophaeus]|nr:bacitracin synthase 3 domain protein [Bacillus atrophaeus]
MPRLAQERLYWQSAARLSDVLRIAPGLTDQYVGRLCRSLFLSDRND